MGRVNTRYIYNFFSRPSFFVLFHNFRTGARRGSGRGGSRRTRAPQLLQGGGGPVAQEIRVRCSCSESCVGLGGGAKGGRKSSGMGVFFCFFIGVLYEQGDLYKGDCYGA